MKAFATICSICGAYRIRSDAPLDDALFDGRLLLSRYTKRLLPSGEIKHVWDAIIERPGDSISNTAHDHQFAEPGTEPVQIDVPRRAEPEDRLSVDSGGTATLVRKVRALVFSGGSAQTNAATAAEGLRDAVQGAGAYFDTDASDLMDFLSKIVEKKHPTLNQWAVQVRPKMKLLIAPRAETFFVRVPGTSFEGQPFPNPFFRVDIPTTQTRFNQMKTQLTTNVSDLDSSWGL